MVQEGKNQLSRNGGNRRRVLETHNTSGSSREALTCDNMPPMCVVSTPCKQEGAGHHDGVRQRASCCLGDRLLPLDRLRCLCAEATGEECTIFAISAEVIVRARGLHGACQVRREEVRPIVTFQGFEIKAQEHLCLAESTQPHL